MEELEVKGGAGGGDEAASERERSLSPIFGFSFDDNGNTMSQWRVDPEQEENGGDGEETVVKSPGKKDEVDGKTEEAMVELTVDTNKELVFPEINYESGGDKEVPGMMMGFMTAGGKEVKVSEKGMAHGKKLLEEELAKVTQEDIQRFSLDKTAGIVGLVPEVEPRMEKNEKLQENGQVPGLSGAPEPTGGFGFVGFTTAAGNPVLISKKSLDLGKKLFEEEQAKNVTEEDIQRFSLDKTAGIAGLVPEVEPRMETNEKPQENVQVPGFFGGFTTAAGKPVLISKKSLDLAKKLFEEEAKNVTEEDIQRFKLDKTTEKQEEQETLSLDIEEMCQSLLADPECEDWSGGNGNAVGSPPKSPPILKSPPKSPPILKSPPKPSPILKSPPKSSPILKSPPKSSPILKSPPTKEDEEFQLGNVTEGRSSTKRRILEERQPEPDNIPPAYVPSKRGRLSRKFVVPRKVDRNQLNNQ